MVIMKSRAEIDIMAQSGRIVAEALNALRGIVRPGVTTREIEKFVEVFVLDKGGLMAFKGYRGYPAGICASVNDEVVHGIPSSRTLKEGDIISIDLGVYKDGFYSDGAVTLPVGKTTPEAERLLRVTEEALYMGIENARPGKRVSDISASIQRHVEARGYSVVRVFVGHGIGRSLHEEPQVPNYTDSGHALRLKEGMTIAIEPMVNAGGYEVRVLEDGWTAVTTDGSLSAHFEHTVAVTGNGAKILTKIE
jgi:methionyl aminopeptidase